MKLTNKNSYPEALLQAIENDPYDKGDAEFSITELLQPPRIVVLRKEHAGEIEEDIDDRLWTLYGQIAHLILERANRGAIAEKRYFATFEGVKISGQVDTLDLDRGTLSDWKFTTAWKFKAGDGAPPEWVAQLNLQLELLRQNGLDADRLEIIGLLRDFSKLEARRNPQYPQQAVQRLAFAPWPREQTRKYLRERILLHRQARLSLPECAAEERWAKPDVYAVMKKGRKTAVRLYPNAEAARLHAESEPAHFVVFRPGESVRCSAYCPVSKFCTQYEKSIASEPAAALATADEE